MLTIFKNLAHQLLPPIFQYALRRIKALFNAKMRKKLREERILRRLCALPPMATFTVTLRGRTLVGVDGQAFSDIYREQFHQEIFRFRTESKAPLILDCGANIGLVTLYMKSIFPEARVIAFEPDPTIFAALKNNCEGLIDISIYNSAVWTTNDEVSFVSAGALGGHLSKLANKRLVGQYKVNAVRLRDFLIEPVDFLKLDIEGSEVDLLNDCMDRLFLVKRMFVEYHSFEGMPQRLGELANIIESAGFRIHIHSSMEELHPFLKVHVYNNKDFRMNLFCYRNSSMETDQEGLKKGKSHV